MASPNELHVLRDALGSRDKVLRRHAAAFGWDLSMRIRFVNAAITCRPDCWFGRGSSLFVGSQDSMRARPWIGRLALADRQSVRTERDAARWRNHVAACCKHDPACNFAEPSLQEFMTLHQDAKR